MRSTPQYSRLLYFYQQAPPPHQVDCSSWEFLDTCDGDFSSSSFSPHVSGQRTSRWWSRQFSNPAMTVCTKACMTGEQCSVTKVLTSSLNHQSDSAYSSLVTSSAIHRSYVCNYSHPTEFMFFYGADIAISNKKNSAMQLLGFLLLRWGLSTSLHSSARRGSNSTYWFIYLNLIRLFFNCFYTYIDHKTCNFLNCKMHACT